jgi:ankyrin repeat protein
VAKILLPHLDNRNGIQYIKAVLLNVIIKGLINDNNDLEASLNHVKKYFADNGDVNQKTDDNGRTPLLLAIRNSFNTTTNGYNIDVVKAVLSKKPDISAKDSDGESAIFYGKICSNRLVIKKKYSFS